MKNPWMSLWLSAANKAAGTARGLRTAEARRQQTAATKAMTTAAKPKPAKKSTARRRAK